ncbi:MAG TPA: ABC transporter substrate-binding protein, partial [Candidatus Methylomirabilis sp.]|nr:ABC transporter substrate-binding protein [Candidatus Methylomirabilis sp.]
MAGALVFGRNARKGCPTKRFQKEDPRRDTSQSCARGRARPRPLRHPGALFRPQPAKVYRIGWLSTALAPELATPGGCSRNDSRWAQAWGQELRERGYIPGQNLVIECRFTQGRQEQALALAADLVSRNPDLIVVEGTNQVRAVKQATSMIPIVMWGVLEPVRRGLVASLARPGGNVTGVADTASADVFGKYLQLLKEAVPAVSRVATLNYSVASAEPAWVAEIGSQLETTARALGVTLQHYRIREPKELEGALAAMITGQAEAFLVVPHPTLSNSAQRIVEFAARNRLPGMYYLRPFVEAGGLMAYMNDELEVARRLGAYVDRILKGAKPGDLPVEQPAKFMLILNLKTAKTL